MSFGKEAIERGTEIGSTENFKFDFKRDIGRPIASDTPDHTRVNSIILSALVLNEFRKRAYVEMCIRDSNDGWSGGCFD